MKRYTFMALALFALAAAVPLFALDGQVVTVNGKCEFQDAAGVWKTLKSGDPVTSGTMISTGFKSEATVKLGGSMLTIRPLTRMTLTQLVEREDTVDTELYLEVGNVKAEVNPLNNKKNGFTVKSPVATASVRGTVFEIGEDLVVIRGSVAFVTPIGQKRVAKAGQELKLVGESVASPVAALQTKMETIVLTSTPATEVKSPVVATTVAAPPPPPVITAAKPKLQPTPTTLALEVN
jgi:Uncharacterized protein conserved in bacteria